MEQPHTGQVKSDYVLVEACTAHKHMVQFVARLTVGVVAAAEALSSVVVRSMGDGGWPAMWKTEQQDRTQTTRNPQARKSIAGKAYCGFQFCGQW